MTREYIRSTALLVPQPWPFAGDELCASRAKSTAVQAFTFEGPLRLPPGDAAEKKDSS